jgi:hypothetical protein
MSWLAPPISARGEQEWDLVPYAVSEPVGVTKLTMASHDSNDYWTAPYIPSNFTIVAPKIVVGS